MPQVRARSLDANLCALHAFREVSHRTADTVRPHLAAIELIRQGSQT
jgi:hypothetical protein